MNVQTVLGPVPLAQLGRTLMHEHLFIAFDGAQFDPAACFDRVEVVNECVRRLKALKAHGVQTFVDPCPIELGRDVRLMAEISERAEMHVVCATGFYHESMGLPPYWRQRTVEEIAALYIDEIERGIDGTAIRAGIIKCATGDTPITALERKFLVATSMAHKATGVPILTHTQMGLFGPEQQDEFERNGVPMHRCLIGHCCNNPDPAYHRRIVARGSYIGFDRIGMTKYHSDDLRADNVVRLLQAGYGPQVMLSQDRYCAWRGKPYQPLTPAQQAEVDALRSQGAWPPLHTHLFTQFLPMLRERGVDEQQIFSLLDDNPRRFFAGDALAPPVARGHAQEGTTTG